ncbi:Hint domain-containing protein [Sulfitobacter sp. S190]|uniref:Hint domain-containing protein n=1 Tax=Sulfitobacter sp. S190 TaxID=2867022 RepID=UPI0021A6B79B|nr:Hint domain-containing protein [Sulfitobacter sp. S190]UWR22546.1 Hint domain-containing protein [Sulfitobacter sp. S190]
MPTVYKDQFYTIDPGNPPGGGTPVTQFRAEVTDTNDNGLLQPGDGDLFEGVNINRVWEGDTLTINVPGVGNVTYTGTTFYLDSGPAVFTPTDGQVLQDGTFVSSTFVTTSTNMPVGDFGPTCFTPGTLIDIPGGTCPVEEIAVGDLVHTMDNGTQPVRLILRQTVQAEGAYAPVRIAAGALGNTAPLSVSQEHRMLIDDWRAELILGCEEILVAAKHLVNGTTVQVMEGGTVSYVHLLFDDHQIVFGNGIPSESCLPDVWAPHITAAQRRELCALYPQLAQRRGVRATQTARQVARAREAQCLIAA